MIQAEKYFEKEVTLSPNHVYLEWRLVSEKKECGGHTSSRSGWFHTISSCAASCLKGPSSIFYYARSNVAHRLCNDDDGCQCYCEKGVEKEVEFKTIDAPQWDMYSFEQRTISCVLDVHMCMLRCPCIGKICFEYLYVV